MAQQVKDPALPQLWHRLQLWHRFNPLTWELPHAACVTKKKKQNKTKQNKTKQNNIYLENKESSYYLKYDKRKSK